MFVAQCRFILDGPMCRCCDCRSIECQPYCRRDCAMLCRLNHMHWT